MQSSWSLLPPAHQIPQAAGAAQGPGSQVRSICSSWTAGAWHHRRSLLPIHWPIEAGAAEQPPIPQFVSNQSSPGRDFQGSPKVGTLSTTDGLAAPSTTAPRRRTTTNLEDDGPSLPQLKSPRLSIYLPSLLDSSPHRNWHFPPRDPSPKHLSRPLSRISPRPARFTATRPATSTLLACFTYSS